MKFYTYYFYLFIYEFLTTMVYELILKFHFGYSTIFFAILIFQLSHSFLFSHSITSFVNFTVNLKSKTLIVGYL